jgi:hypothetical protein
MDIGVHCARLAHDSRSRVLLFRPSAAEKCTVHDLSERDDSRSGHIASASLSSPCRAYRILNKPM